MNMAVSLPQEFEPVEKKYQKVLKIGCGTFGEAWLVKSLCSGRNYVMKEVKVSDLSEEELEKTQREAAVLARCKHINIVRYKESFLMRNPLTMCLVMEYADGGDLYEKVKQSKIMNKLIPEVSIMSWFIQIVFAVQYLHRNNILHRDLKTQNIFLTQKNIVKVGDFGIARFLRTKQELATTAIGTPYYLSPEICLRKPYNYRSDMWSLGCILYELCALQHPFEANDFENLVVKILQGAYPPVSCIYSKLIHDLITVLLRTNPEQRPSAEQILVIPGLKQIVQGYLKRHDEIMANFTSGRISPGSPANHAQFFQPRNPSSGYRLSSVRSKENYGWQESKDLWQPSMLRNIVSNPQAQFSPSECGKKERKDSQTQTPPEWIAKSKKEYQEKISNSYFNCYQSPNISDPKVAVVSPVKEMYYPENSPVQLVKEMQTPKNSAEHLVDKIKSRSDVLHSPTLGKTFTVLPFEKIIQSE